MSEEKVVNPKIKELINNNINPYTFECTLPGSKEVIKFKPITTSQMKRLISVGRKNVNLIEDALDNLLNECVISPENFDPKKLYLQDRFFLLIYLRAKTKGEEYSYVFNCPKCKGQTINLIDFTKIQVKEYPENINHEINVEGTDIVLYIDHITREEQKESIDYSNVLNETDVDKETNQRFCIAAAKIKSILKPEKIDLYYIDAFELLSSLPYDVMKNIENWSINNNFGIDLVREIKCNSCDNTIKQVITLNNFFF